MLICDVCDENKAVQLANVKWGAYNIEMDLCEKCFNKTLDFLKKKVKNFQVIMRPQQFKVQELQQDIEIYKFKANRAVRQLTELKAKNPKVDGIIEIRESLKDN